MIFLNSENFRKCSEFIVKFAVKIGTAPKHSQKMKPSIGSDFEKFSKGRQQNCCAQVMTGK